MPLVYYKYPFLTNFQQTKYVKETEGQDSDKYH